MPQIASQLSYLQEHEKDILQDLMKFVRAESPSDEKELVDQCGKVLEEIFLERLGVKPVRYPQAERGDHLKFTVGKGEKRILIAGHFDTVWDKGRLPIVVEDGKFFGPGVLDMKSGIIQSIWAVKVLLETGITLDKEIVFLCTSDEEVGSQTSRPLIEEEAQKSDVVLITEPPVAKTGALKTARKGVGIYNLKIQGTSSHAGNHHQDGVSAVKELAQQIVKLENLTDYQKGTTVNVGVVNGGTRRNVVPEEAEALIDFRVKTKSEAERMVDILDNLTPTYKGIDIEVEGELNRPPMERTEEIEGLFFKAQEAAYEVGFELDEAHVGGGSDGNFTAFIGVPTLDGLGCPGEGPHAEYEHIIVDELSKRSALLSHLLPKL
ncbi:M20 family metallopeptidase [Pseudalkalibacillus caeni]|uniref:M20 family metallopeptidase n=1 Tax=Exobacillus caeni TaxID=2574798 RepID=A0A5R9F8W0_9BACL|nr:M20 family metallopeptidase [Pseudalkalibacillus caeni]TLS38700.1 M20 family metallopeptidase [Pseudalkalibacillus caeni]